MERTVRILIQTTTAAHPDDWSIESLSLLRQHLEPLREGGMRFEVTGRNRERGPDGDDPVLASIDRSPYDELWVFALDVGDGITIAECESIARFRQRRGGILATRDHANMGSSLCTLGGIAPSFVTEPEGQGMKREPRALQDIRRYVRNLAVWLAPARVRSNG